MGNLITITRLEVDADGYDAAGCYYGAGQNGCQWLLEGVFGTRAGFTPHRLNHNTLNEAALDAMAAIPVRHQAESLEVIDATTDEARVVFERGVLGTVPGLHPGTGRSEGAGEQEAGRDHSRCAG